VLWQEAARSSETSVSYRYITRRRNREDFDLNMNNVFTLQVRYVYKNRR